ncbi:TPA: ABC transporter ATP-binding protein [Streptococcus equi subsp. zooepidemicus]|uniref:ABC transporter ATP-binding protein n=1 Tax=Streptococcus equi TaxID=1336 RepID=UPI001E2E2301|nr:ABC transporter ATP-binding protein [Streptococcus equi]MCD3423974.1 ABC transporter ATP-binding protein [Streptococcus equi subsp. zooepidemicus]HEL0025383.1 ABC transporter ATP-binding protein [Streptococcus equi subsp. zooepidemicus]HEL0733053.1 ABC transporter ATP-binding protein [Streptococcus equi subsp. zooepidemicus]HEL1058682.1 ABC transporter ATP-binding protein [Streptococcus equi subsp. zooepidemicus]HEL1102587.1 ABC transporter ATP-binding protein [Streptococcus equi subsp. zoo
MFHNVAVNVIDLTKDFLLEKNKKVSVLKGVTLSANYGEFISILGISGSGKSTLLNCLASLSEPSGGEVVINGVNPYRLKDGKLAKFRREDIAIIFQNYNLVPALPALENVTLPLRLSGKTADRNQVKTLLDNLNFKADLSLLVSTLSGGEQQKIAISRAILSDSKVIFADEPTGALDSISRKLIFESLRKMADEGKCVLMVTHDIELASKTDKAFILKDGYISQEITKPSAEELYQALETIGE